MTGTRRQKRKAQALPLLQQADWAGLLRWVEKEPGALSTLIALLLTDDTLLRWRTIDGLGRAAAAIAAADLDTVRDLVRRQLWSMNDESGGVAWFAPQAVGEILFQVPPLAEEFALILTSYGDIEPYRGGAHWAAARLAPRYPRQLAQALPALARVLADQAPAVRGFAASALGQLGYEPARPALERLHDDPALLTCYRFEQAALCETSVGALAREALAALAERG